MAKAHVICRCEEVEIDTIRKYIAEGCTTLEELKRALRVTMGPCQGRGCRDIILRELSRATGKPVAELSTGTFRQPVKPIKIGLICNYNNSNK